MSRRVRVEKRKWDGSIASVVSAWLVHGSSSPACWFVPRGTTVDGLVRAEVETDGADEIWLTAPGEWWVLCGQSVPGAPISRIELHAAMPVEHPEPALVRWVDLDLDFVVERERVELSDVDEFHRRARQLGYPAEVVYGAWAGIAQIAPRYTTGEWPYDGTLDRYLEGARDAGLGHGRP